MGMLSLDRNHPDYLKARVLVTLFGGYFGSRLMSNIREDEGYTYGISAASCPILGRECWRSVPKPPTNLWSLLSVRFIHEIDRLQNELASDGELSMVKNYMLGDMCRSYESAFSLADARIFVQVSGLQDTYFAEALDAVKEVTPQEIRELAGRHLCKEKLKEIVCGKKNVIKSGSYRIILPDKSYLCQLSTINYQLMKYLYTALILLSYAKVEPLPRKKSGFFDKVKSTFSSEIKIGTYNVQR